MKARKFKSIFSGNEYFFLDHMVNEIKVLPGAAYLELARAAGEIYLNDKVRSIHNVNWLSMLENKSDPTTIVIQIMTNGDKIEYEISDITRTNQKVLNSGVFSCEPLERKVSFNIESIKKQLPNYKSGSDCYHYFDQIGLVYGERFKGMQELYYSDQESLARILLKETDNSFVLPPEIIDNAFQTCVGINFSIDREIEVPFTVKTVEIYQALQQEVWTYVKKNEKKGIINSYDIYVLNNEGEVLVSFSEFATLPIQDKNNTKQDLGITYLPTWDRISILEKTYQASESVAFVTGYGKTDERFLKGLEERLLELGTTVTRGKELSEITEKPQEIYWLNGLFPMEKDAAFQNVEKTLFEAIKHFQIEYENKSLRLTVLTFQNSKVFEEGLCQTYGGGIAGLIGSLAKEETNWEIRLIDLGALELTKTQQRKLVECSYDYIGEMIALRSDFFYQEKLYPFQINSTKTNKLKRGGVYVILGGAGGIGEVTSQFLIEKYNAKIVWLGRSPLSHSIEQASKELGKYGTEPLYIQCDATDQASMENARNQVKLIHNQINGLFHSAIVLDDKLMANMTLANFEQVFLPKSLGSHNFIESFQDENLDFICFYSSIQSQWRAKGQANYAAACSYKDNYSRFITQQTGIPCHTINWGYWGETGIVSGKGYRERMASLGIGSISASMGMTVLENTLAQNHNQIVAIQLSDQASTPMYNLIHDRKISQVKNISKIEIEAATIPLYKKDLLVENKFKQICCQGVLKEMLGLGLGEAIERVDSKNSLSNELGILEKHNPLFTEVLRELSVENYIQTTDNQIQFSTNVRQEIEQFDLDKALKDFVFQHASYEGYAKLLSVCIERFNNILLGNTKAIDIIFPYGSLDMVSAVYNGGKQSDYFNNLLSTSIVEGIKKLGADEKIRILEIGAGTGGTSQFLFEKLVPFQHQVEYIYTDLSQSFLLHAEENYSKLAPYLKTQIFNIEHSPQEQGLEIGGFDVVIGANVIHATKNIKATLSNIKQVLKKEGVLMLNELAKTELFSTLTFGLLDGWWNYNDEEIRLKGSPGLSATSWKTVLQGSGFTAIDSSPKVPDLPQQIIKCVSDGMITLNAQHQKIDQNPAKVKTSDIANSIPVSQEKYKPKVTKYLRSVFSRILKLDESRIGFDTPFSALGVDSILIGTLSKELSKEFGEVSTTNFFEYGNIDELAHYFLENQLDYFAEDEPQEKSRIATFESKPIETQQVSEDMPQTSKYSTTNINEPIAIIGVGGKYPEADTIEAFWENLKAGKDCITEIPTERWDNEQYYGLEKGEEGVINSNYGGFLDGIEQFDPLFFNISPIDAEKMDPQERLFLQTVWESIEDAGYAVNKLAEEKTGVYVGVMYEEYQLFGAEESLKGNPLVLGGSASSIANRVSYFCNFRGPSMAIDTMCSSSLTAVHLACNDLRLGNTNIAIAGGVNITTHPNKYLMLSRGAFLSNRGKCESFGSEGEGFIPGEGVGAVVLKKLSDAKRDGDRIYAIIRGSSVNHGGKANGYTVPKPTAQAEVINDAIQQAGVSPEKISYIEAHGTGTSLGDPVEIAGLVKAFGTNKTQFCSIGSVKSNIGHCESAAGIAGLTKVILQLKHNTLVPSLHSKELNPNINFQKGPFKVQQKLEPWSNVDSQPKLAGISSFGAGGSNAHLILEEFIQRPTLGDNPKENLILLSAKNKERLKVLVQNLKQHIENKEEVNLTDLAYTLQVGRTVMEERLAFVVKDTHDLIARLTEYLVGNLASLLVGNSMKNGVDLLINNAAGKTFVNTIIQNKEVVVLGQLWVNGVTINWNLIYDNQRPNKISLPTYPFAKEEYWFKSLDGHSVTTVKYKHPLLHENTTTLNELKFTTTLTGKENYLNDHLVRGEKILSGVAYLEMCREAGERVTQKKISIIKNIIWLRPIKIENTDVAIYTSLIPVNQDVDFSIYSEESGEHCKGTLSNEIQTKPNHFNLSEIKARLTETKTGEKCYDFFESLNLKHGKSFQGIKELSFNETEALSKIELPRDEQNVLNPGILDSALQTCSAFSFNKEQASLFLPFSLRKLIIHSDLSQNIWCYAIKNNTKKDDKIDRYTIYILNEAGEPLISFIEFVTLPLDQNIQTEGEELVCYENKWEKSVLQKDSNASVSTNQLLLVLGESDEIAKNIQANFLGEVQTINESSEEETFSELFNLIYEKIQLNLATEFVLVYDSVNELKFGFLVGLLRTAKIESTSIDFRIIRLDKFRKRAAEDIANLIRMESLSLDREVMYNHKKRKRKVLAPLLDFGSKNVPSTNQIKEGGVYVVVGGTGGIGSIIVTEISKVANTNIILLGRNPKMDELPNSVETSAKISYMQCDITVRAQVEQCIQEITEKYESINGIIQSAGVIKDSLIADKTRDEINAVLKVKIQGVKNLDQATKSQPLDFMVLFSSIASITGNRGQADYAAANSFVDAFASHRNKRVKKDKRRGKTISINWPLWKDGGMEMSDDLVKEVKKSWGIAPLSKAKGIEVFHASLESNLNQVAVYFGIKKQINRKLESILNQIPKIVKELVFEGDIDKQIQDSILSIISNLTKLDPKKINKNEEFGNYGFDSVSLVKFANELSEYYQLDITPAVFFNSPTVDKLTVYLQEEFGNEIASKYKKVKRHKIKITEPETTATLINDENRSWLTKPLSSVRAEKEELNQTEIDPVVIVGVSGRFPGTKNLNHFWESLKENIDLISEVPEDRWDWKAIYGDPTKEKNKTKAKWGGFINNIGNFDPLFFNISPAEAELMDPQQRITLLAVYDALEDAGIPTGKIKGTNTGVYIGCSSSDYKTLIAANEGLINQTLATTGTSQSVLVNRISYLLDLHGPSEPIDTACSSSLIAIHRAVENINKGDCEMAIAGGVNVLLTPELTLSFSQAGVLSSDGRCKTFDERANGYVRGEGVGVVVLKKLSKAKADGDHIYAIIKGTAENHGGKANTMTSPNSNAQKELLLKAYRMADVDPRDVGYIEAHGTGTSLGDPVECEGLKLAFKQLYKERGLELQTESYCGLGSVKTNVGHLEAAAGIAGLVKLLLAIKHKTIPGNVHLDVPNPYLNFSKTPFYLQKETTSWDTKDNKPRIAGVSSFGAGGSNAHIVIEEYIPDSVPDNIEKDQPYIILLSAKNAKRLHDRARDLKEHLESTTIADLQSLAFTLQVGREHMEERLAFEANNQTDIIESLTNFLSGNLEKIITGNVRKTSAEFSMEDEVREEKVSRAIEQYEVQSLIQLWISGVLVEWNALYNHDAFPTKLSLPTYPFDKKFFWVPTLGNPENKTVERKLHPLLHQNESTLIKQQFTSIYTGEEIFLKDHKVNGEKMLPGVAYLELVREAGEKSLNKKVTGLKEVIWLTPIRVNGTPQKIRVNIFEKNSQIGYEIYSTSNGDIKVHGKGKLLTEKHQQTANKYDISALKQQLIGKRSQEECYDHFKQLGLNYGNSFQGIKKLYFTDKHALSKIELPELEGYVLSPGILDSALQTCAGLSFANQNQAQELPFSAKEVNLLGSLSGELWCYVEKVLHGNKKVSNYHIRLLNSCGEEVFNFIDFAALPISELKHSKTTDVPKIQTYQSVWRPETIIKTQDNVETIILLNESTPHLAEKIEEELELEVLLLPSLDEVDKSWNLIETIKNNSQKRIQFLFVYQNSDLLQVEFLSGILKTAQLEFPKLKAKTFGVDQLTVKNSEELINQIEIELNGIGDEVRYSNGQREAKRIEVNSKIAPANNLQIKENGTYLITGGFGGLGQIMAEHISKTKNTRLVIFGRSALDPQRTGLLEKWNNAIYFPCNLNDKESVFDCIAKVKETLGDVSGVIHCAGTTQDSFLLNKKKQEVENVFAPKVNGIKYLDEVLQTEALDFIALFSSITAAIGSAGQAGYSAANAFLNSFAELRNKLVIDGKRKGHTVSINWPLWEEGGIKMVAENQAFLKKKWGMQPLPTREGIEAFELVLKSNVNHCIITFGEAEKMEKALISQQVNQDIKMEVISTTYSVNEIQEILIEICATLLKIDKVDIELDVDFTEYGVDSIMMMNILNSMEERFQTVVEPTIIVNYPTIELLADFLESEKVLKSGEKTRTPFERITKRVSNINGPADETPIIDTKKTASLSQNPKGTKIAVIGMACHLPGSDNLIEFWDNLKKGKELISDTPKDRWNMLDYFSSEEELDKTYTIKGGFINNPGLFDAEYFKISDDAAISMDPQQRIALELSRQLIADSGYDKAELENTNTGVYLGVKDNNYARNNYHLLPEGTHQHTIVNNISNMVAARVSDFYNLKGASIVIDTACSSSLVAIHQACEDIMEGKVEMAIAGGVSVLVDAFGHIAFSQAKVLSKDGHSYVFDERAGGFVLAEGGGVVMLKEYESAIKDGDNIVGTILGSAVNNDGKTMGLTVPNKEGQKEVIQKALDKTGISPQNISYYEAHGTGTLLGDPIEVKAATEVYQRYGANNQFCALGSVKSNLGHNMTAAGVTGLIKILLQMQHNEIAPTINCEKPHPRFKFNESPFYPNMALKKWNNDHKIAAISSFGFGGTNCHLILEKDIQKTESKRTKLTVKRLSNKHFWLGEDIYEVEKEHQLEYNVTEEFSYEENYLKDHLVNNERVILGTTFLGLATNLKEKQFNESLRFTRVLFKNQIALSPDEKTKIGIILEGDRFTVFNEKLKGDEKKEVAEGKIIIEEQNILKNCLSEIDVLKGEGTIQMNKTVFYQKDEEKGIVQGDSLRVIERVYLNKNKCLGELQLPKQDEKHRYELIHPVILNGGLVTTLALVKEIEMPFLPVMIKELIIHQEITENCLVIGEVVKTNREIIETNFKFCSQNGDLLGEIFGFICKRIPVSQANISILNEVERKVKTTELEDTEQFLRRLLQEASSKDLSHISVEKNFMDMGIDSSELIALVKIMEKELGEELYPTLFFEYQNLAELARYLEEEYPNRFNLQEAKDNVIITD